MSKQVTHIIHKLNLELQVGNERAARHAYAHAGELLKQYVLPKLEELLREYDRDDVHIRLDKLDVVVDAAGHLLLEETLRELVPAAIIQRLSAVLANAEHDAGTKDSIRSGKTEHTIEAFIWFLIHGRLPWWIENSAVLADSGTLIEAIAAAETAFVTQFQSALKQHPVVAFRLMQQCDAKLMVYLFSLVAPSNVFRSATRIAGRLAGLSGGASPAALAERLCWQYAWRLWTNDPVSLDDEPAFTQKLERALQLIAEPRAASVAHEEVLSLSNSLLGEYLKPVPSVNEDLNHPEQKNAGESDGNIVPNAGLILLHPFLQHFFAELNLLQDEAFKDSHSAAIAVHLLHYLATGREQAADFDLVFEKYLCGLRPETITDRFIALTEEMKSEADELLTAAIGHWAVLKHTSAGGLREGFLQRKGKIQCTVDQQPGNARLSPYAIPHTQYLKEIIMEASTLDLLLQQIPWNISLFKLPWLPAPVHVEWSQ